MGTYSWFGVGSGPNPEDGSFSDGDDWLNETTGMTGTGVPGAGDDAAIGGAGVISGDGSVGSLYMAGGLLTGDVTANFVEAEQIELTGTLSSSGTINAHNLQVGGGGDVNAQDFYMGATTEDGVTIDGGYATFGQPIILPDTDMLGDAGSATLDVTRTLSDFDFLDMAAGSSLTVGGTFEVEAMATLEAGSAATVNSGVVGLFIASDPFVNGLLSVQTASSLTVDGDLDIGAGTTGELAVANIGIVNVDGDLTVGDPSGGFGTVVVDSVSAVIVQGTVIIAGDGYGEVDVNESSVFKASQEVDVGDGTGLGFLFVGTGGEFEALAGTLSIGVEQDSFGFVQVSDAGSELLAPTVLVGDAGIGTLKVLNGATASLTVLYVGAQAGSDGLVTDTGSTIEVGQVVVGYFSDGELDLASGATMTSTEAWLGLEDTGIGTVTVDASDWTASAAIVVGQSGTGDLEIRDIGSVTSTAGVVGGEIAGSGTVIVAGDGSEWDITGDATFGATGTADVTISGNAEIASVNGTVGSQYLSDGTVDITGQGSDWFTSGSLIVGDNGDGTVDVNAGGVLAVGGNSLVIGSQLGSTGEVDLTGSSSILAFNGSLTVGDVGDAVFSLASGATYATTGDLKAGVQDVGSGTISLAGTATQLTVNGTATIGDAGQGALLISGGAALVVYGDLIEGAQDGSGGADTISDANAAVTVHGDWKIGAAGVYAVALTGGVTVEVDGETNLGESNTGQGTLTESGADTKVTTGGATIGDGGGGTMNLSGGAAFDSSAGDVSLGEQAGSTSSVTVSDDDTELDAASLTVGGGGSASLDVLNGGNVSVTNDLDVGESDGGGGSVNIDATGGESSLSAGDVSIGGEGDGTVDVSGPGASLSGGDVAVGESKGGNGLATVESGTITASGDLTIGGSGTGKLAVTVGGSISASAVKIGDQSGGVGTLTLDGAGTELSASADVTVGSGGQGALSISNGASLLGMAGLTLADQANGMQQTATVAHGQITLVADLAVGGSGMATMLLENGGIVLTSGNIAIGDQTGAMGALTVTGTATTLGWGGTLAVGNAGEGALTVAQGAKVAAAVAGTGTVEIGASANGSGTLTLTDLGSTLTTQLLTIGGSNSAAAGSGLLSIATGATVTAATVTVWSTGDIAMDGGLLATDPITVDGDISGFGTIAGAMVDNGTVTASGGVLTLSGGIGGSGTLSFAGTSTLVLGQPGTGIGNAVEGLAAGDRIELAGITVQSARVTSPGTVTVTTGGADFVLSDVGFAPGAPQSFVTGHDTVTGDDYLQVTCFAAGTRILTRDGPVPVEHLRVGDPVVTLEAGAQVVRPVRWIGHRRIDPLRHVDPRLVWPICVRRDAIAPSVPERDLYVSPEHAFLLDGILVPARLLRNDTTILQDRRPDRLTYFHLEFDRHTVVLAENMPAESYLDTGNRASFENAGPVVRLRPDGFEGDDQARRVANSCAPFVDDPVVVERIWRAIADRAAAPGLPILPTTDDPEPRVAIGQRSFRPIVAQGGRYVFALPASDGAVRLTSRAASPSDLRPWIGDRRRLGVAVSRLTVRFGGTTETVALDDPRLARGWWDPERSASGMWRWTNGDASLPVQSGRSMTLEIELSGLSAYPLITGDQSDAAARTMAA